MEQLQEGLTPAVGEAQIKHFMEVLRRYAAGRAATARRIQSSENWWKLRNTAEEQKLTELGKDGGFVSRSGWLHNVIVSKHADAMENYPEPLVLPRERSDEEEARTLSRILPCILEQNRFEGIYSDAMWQKLKTGTGVYKVFWDAGAENGLGDIAIRQVNLLDLYWEPGIRDIQRSRYLFHVELVDREVLESRFPGLKLRGSSFLGTRFLMEEQEEISRKAAVIDVYYRKPVEGRMTLQYCQFTEGNVLFATENQVEPMLDSRGKPMGESLARRGLYDHGKFPYVFDVLYPVEGSPCGYGYVDICQNPQLEIDLLKTSIVKNAMVGATPRYLNCNSGINEEEFLDLSKPIVHASSVDERNLRRIDYQPVDGVYVGILDRTIQELRETSGNTETSTGNISSGVTAASAIAALQEASGKGSRDCTRTSYRAFAEVVYFCQELVRQFYDTPRKFRVTGEGGGNCFLEYSNQKLRPQEGEDGYARLPVFDIRVVPQKQDFYTRLSQNEMALQFFSLGFFDPRMASQARACLEMMDFEGREKLLAALERS